MNHSRLNEHTDSAKQIQREPINFKIIGQKKQNKLDI